jgi:signal transduction histidine kinase
MKLYHCMSHDWLWIGITIFLDVAVASGYVLIALHWWRNQQRVGPSPARRRWPTSATSSSSAASAGTRSSRSRWSGRRGGLYDMFMLVLAYQTWRYALRAKDLKVIYAELGRTTQLAADLEKSREESRKKTHFLNALSHDLRTPLNGIGLQAQVARMAAEGNDVATMRSAVAEIEAGARTSAELLNSLLQCARLDWTEEPNTVSEFPLDGLLRSVAASSEAAAAARGLELRVTCPADVVVRTDRVKVERVLTNLLSNAVKFTDKGG